MGAIDYLKFRDPDHLAVNGAKILEARQLYGDQSGIEYRYDVLNGQGRQEAVRFDDDLHLLFGEVAPYKQSVKHQIVSEGDWIHIQFRVSGGGNECVGDGSSTATDPHTCIITRYPDGALIRRETQDAAQWRAACLYFRPRLVRSLLGSSLDLLNEDWRWIYDDAPNGTASASFPMTTPEMAAINDLFACAFRRGVRRNYMYAKALELFSHATNRLCEVEECDVAIKLSEADRRRIASCREILLEHMDEQLTLSQLARRVGVNRSKLAVGFKFVFGMSVQAYWRELRLCHARDLLSDGEHSVTEVSASVGYADISCLTRAYYKRFGHLPKDSKGVGYRLSS